MSITETYHRIASHKPTVGPGSPLHWTAATHAGTYAHQGDLILTRVDCVPADYIEVIRPTDSDRQLVPEGGAGSHHRLASLDGVRLFRPPDWGRSEADLRGPCVVFESPNRIVHEPGHNKPHGPHIIEDQMILLCTYQRNLDAEERAVRALD